MSKALNEFKQHLKHLKETCANTRKEIKAGLVCFSDGSFAGEAAKHDLLKTKLEKQLRQLEDLETEIQKSLGRYARKTLASPASGLRHFPRYNRRVPVRYSQINSRTQVRAYTHDIGAMGLFVLTSKMEKKGLMLNLEVDLPDIGTVKLQGVVAWTKWVPPALRNVQYAGFGVKVSNAPESWFSYFMNQEETAT